jgi:hypothetical protein
VTQSADAPPNGTVAGRGPSHPARSRTQPQYSIHLFAHRGMWSTTIFNWLRAVNGQSR